MLMLKRHVQSLIDKGAFTQAIGMAAEFFRRNPDSAAGLQLVAMAEEARAPATLDPTNQFAW